MKGQRQLKFQNASFKSKLTCGGSLQKSHPKGKRPFHSKKALHIVLRSDVAKGTFSFLRRGHSTKVEEVINEQAKRFHIRIYKISVAGNHIHLLIRAYRRRALNGFLRAISGLIPRRLFGLEKGHDKSLFDRGFWLARPWSRIVDFGRRTFGYVMDYLELNRLEAIGFIPYQPRKARYRPPP